MLLTLCHTSEINCDRVTLANNIDEFDADNLSFAKRRGTAKVVNLESGKNAVKSQEEQERNKPTIEHNAVMGNLFNVILIGLRGIASCLNDSKPFVDCYIQRKKRNSFAQPLFELCNDRETSKSQT